MAQDGPPAVYVVDTCATKGPPLPPRPSQRREQQRQQRTQTLLMMLVTLALVGMTLEACFIYRLYQPQPAFTSQVPSSMSSKVIGARPNDEADPSPTKWYFDRNPPSKPLAHMTGGKAVVHKKQIMMWSATTFPLLYQMDYKDGGLVVQREGYYYVYSKVSFSDSGLFDHTVLHRSDMFRGKDIPLLLSKKVSPVSDTTRSNSYLGGVFHLHEGDFLYVKVSNATKIRNQKYCENVFGAFML